MCQMNDDLKFQLTLIRPAYPSANHTQLCYYLHSPWDSGARKIRTFVFASYFTEINIPPDTFQGIDIKFLKYLHLIHIQVNPTPDCLIKIIMLLQL